MNETAPKPTAPHLVKDQPTRFPHEDVLDALKAALTPPYEGEFPHNIARGAKRLAPHQQLEAFFRKNTETQETIVPFL